MFCPECGSEITEEMKFCANCGFKVTDDMRKTKTEANKSQNDIPLATNVEEVEDDEVADEIKTDEKVVETNTVATEKPSVTDKAKAKISQMWSSLSMFGKVMTIGIGISALLFLIALAFGTIFSVIFSVLQIALLVFACLMKKGVIKTPNKMLQIVLPIIALVLIVPYMLLFSVGSEYKDAERINWSELIMGEVIPEPASNLGEVYLNSDDYLSVEIVKLSAEQYKEYLTVCKDKGFTVDSDQSDTLYDAYNKDGYKLHLYYYEGENELDISLNAPIKMSQMTWSTSDYGKMLPTPKSTLGRIEKDDKTGLTVYIGETTLDDYNAYVTACTEKGFTVNSKKTEKTFTASNAEGYKLTVDYKGNNTMYISLKEPEFETEIKVVCRENLMFRTYDVEFYIDDNSVGSIEHGKTETFTETLKKGTHTIKFENTDDDGVIGEVEVEITKLEKLEFMIWCYSDKIDIDVVSGYVKEETSETGTTGSTEISLTKSKDDFKGMSTEDAEKSFREMGFTKFDYETVDTEEKSSDGTICYIEITEFLIGDSDFAKGDKFASDSTVTFYSYEYEEPEKPSPVFYSTNDYETAKKGNTGVFSYKNKSGSYDIYWIINFDEGYVYWFTEGNGESTCDKVKIVSGDLNDKITVTWHDGGDEWSWYLHFKYVNHPETLVVNDHKGFATEFTTIDLDDALSIRSTKTIKNY